MVFCGSAFFSRLSTVKSLVLMLCKQEITCSNCMVAQCQITYFVFIVLILHRLTISLCHTSIMIEYIGE